MNIDDKVFELMIDTLNFYADPDTYFAIGIFPDRPCGEFIDDFSEVDYPYFDFKPGKRARETLDAVATSKNRVDIWDGMSK